MLFVAFTAEEQGMLGSHYFVHYPPVPASQLAASMNIDMLAWPYETTNMAPLGFSHSNMVGAAQWASTHTGLALDLNEAAQQRYFMRSDQRSFIQQGIPAVYITAGQTARNPELNGEALFNHFMKHTYHSPQDGPTLPYSHRAFLKAARFNALTLYYLAQQPNSIQWQPSSSLYQRYGHKQALTQAER